MYKLLIVDDEIGVCDLIYNLVEWEQLGLICVGSVQSGLEAERMIREQCPDFVITDIQMPGITGLQLIERYAGQESPQFIVVSGYQEFEYAQRALRFGVEDYLLKPIRKDDLNLVLRNMARKKQSADSRSQTERRLQMTIAERTALLRASEWRQMLLDGSHMFRSGLFCFEKGLFVCMGVHLGFRNAEEISAVARERILSSIESRLKERLRGDCFDLESVLLSDILFLLINYSEEVHGDYRAKREMLQTIQKEASVQYENTRLTCAMSAVADSPEELSFVVRTVRDALELRVLLGCQRVIDFRQLDSLPHKEGCGFTEHDKQMLLKYVGSLQAAQAYTLLDQMFSPYEDEVFETCRLIGDTLQLATFLYQGIFLIGMREKPAEGMEGAPPDLEQLDELIRNCYSIRALKQCLHDYIACEIVFCTEQKKRKDSEPILIAKQYVRDNIGKQISLEEVAAQIYVSPGYFSTLFKEKAGIGFTDFVIEERMEHAKQLLRATKDSVGDIATSVGYADARHFSKVFAKTVGIKPTEYRRFYG